MAHVMRILFLMEDLCFGGTQRQMLELAARLDRSRFAPVMLTLTGPTDLDGLARQAGIEVHNLGRDRRLAPFFFGRVGPALRRLRPDLSLAVYDAGRPMSVQQKMWNVVKDTPKYFYVSNPARGGGLHNYGLAVDLTLCDAATGDTLDMGTRIDYMGAAAHIDREDELRCRGKLSAQAVRNRQLLRRVMREAGFKPLRTEWWHFNFKSRAEAKARYKVIR